MTDKWTDRLSEYLDGDLTAMEQTALEAHVAHCADCSAVLDELRGVVARAQALDDRPPARDLWQGIAALIGSNPAAAPKSRQRRVWFTVPQLAAAALALMLGSGAVVYRLASNVASAGMVALEPGDEIPVSMRAAAALGEARIDSTVAELEFVLENGRGTLDTSTVRIIRENLAIIDVAIAQARRALVDDPGNVYLNNNLAGSMKRKVELLRRANQLAASRS